MSKQSTDLPQRGQPTQTEKRASLDQPSGNQPPAAAESAQRPARPRRISVLGLLSRSLSVGLVVLLAACVNNTPLPKTAGPPDSPEAEDIAQAVDTREKPEVDPAVQRVFDQAVALLRQQQYSQVVDTLSPVAEQQPELPGLLVNLAIAYIHLERQEQATAVLQQALSTDPQHPAALNWLAILERRAGRFEEAKALYQQLLATHPESRHGHLNLGILCDLYLRQAECALEHYRRYQELAAEADPEVDHWIADLERREQQG